MATPALTVIVPAHDAARTLGECLAALRAAATPDTEIVVVDDGSRDDTAEVATAVGVRLVRLAANAGPAYARNAGAEHARGAILLFVDADVVVGPDLVRRVARVLADRPDVAAVFGSYDARPRAPGLVSQFRNLLHHFVHQHAKREASTFWAGCGAIRRPVFEAVGGFDVERWGRAIEDVELGYRLRAAGYRILLDPTLQVTHLKHWTLASLVRTDVAVRAIPWSRLVLERGAPDDLNLETAQRVSVGLAGVAAGGLLLAPLGAGALAVSAAAAAAVVLLNGRLFAFFARQRGARFALGCLPLLFLYYLYSGASFAWVWAGARLRGAGRAAVA